MFAHIRVLIVALMTAGPVLAQAQTQVPAATPAKPVKMVVRDRLDWSIPEGTEAVILELGANDALRGTDPAVTRAALTEILTRLKARKIAVLMCGMLAPPNYGSEYAARFNAIYPELSKSFGVPLYPFFLEGVAAEARLNQADGLHPTAEGVDIIVKNILPSVEAFLGALSAQRS